MDKKIPTEQKKGESSETFEFCTKQVVAPTKTVGITCERRQQPKKWAQSRNENESAVARVEAQNCGSRGGNSEATIETLGVKSNPVSQMHAAFCDRIGE